MYCVFKIWPKGIPAAGSFWNYNKEIKQGTEMYQSLIQHVHQVSVICKALVVCLCMLYTVDMYGVCVCVCVDDKLFTLDIKKGCVHHPNS